MPAGLLEVDGSIDLAQFWPVGSSDADTSQIHVDVGAGAFRFRPNPGASRRCRERVVRARLGFHLPDAGEIRPAVQPGHRPGHIDRAVSVSRRARHRRVLPLRVCGHEGRSAQQQCEADR